MASTEFGVPLSLFAQPRARPQAAQAAPAWAGGVAVVGRLCGFALDERPLIGELACAPGRVVAGRSTVALCSAMRGREVVVLFEDGEIDKAIIVGVIGGPSTALAAANAAPVQVEADGQRQVLTAEREIVLRCGHASITLTRAGKIVISGTYLVSRSTGPNKIKGGSIDLN